MKDERIVKIKTWDAMVEEFGIEEDNIIHCEYNFTEHLEESLPKNRIIPLHKMFSDVLCIYGWNGFTITDDMIEEEYTPETHPQYFI
jgi:hypothetical protein